MNDREKRASGGDARVIEALQALPQVAPPPSVARRIDALVASASVRPAGGAHRLVRAGLAIAASIVFAVWMVRPVSAPGDRLPAAEPPATVSGQSAAGAASSIDALIERSAYLESVLAAVPRRGRVQRVGTASTITAIEDRVALIDARLNAPELAADESNRTRLWRERVDLMDTLVSLHAQPATVVVL